MEQRITITIKHEIFDSETGNLKNTASLITADSNRDDILQHCKNVMIAVGYIFPQEEEDD